MRHPVIGLAGYARTGKDTVAEDLLDAGYRLTSIGPLVVRLADTLQVSVTVTADDLGQHAELLDAHPERMSDGRAQIPLAAVVQALGYESAKELPQIRSALQVIGSGVKDTPGGGRFWIDWALSEVEGLAVVSGVRSLPEVQAIHDRGGIVVWVSRPGYGPANDHINERQLSAEDCDLHLSNDGTLEQLHDLVRTTLLP